MKRLFRNVWWVIPAVLSPLSFAHAYLDPSSGSYAVQIAMGFLFGASYALKSFGGRIIGGLRNRFKKESKDKE